MKGKLFILMTALVSVFTLSSCLGDEEYSSYPKYERIVTVASGATRLLADNGEVLLPRNTVSGLEKVGRAIVAFNVLPAELNGSELEAGKTYEVELDANYCYSIPTARVINLNNNPVAVDSLTNSQEPVMQVEDVYVKNGYLTATISYGCRQYSPTYLDLAYDSKTDVDVETNTITFTLYYDNKELISNTQIRYPYSFRLPSEEYYNFDASTINVVFRYMVEKSQYREVKATMDKEDFFVPAF